MRYLLFSRRVLLVPLGCVKLLLRSQLGIHRWMLGKNVRVFDLFEIEEAARIICLSLVLFAPVSLPATIVLILELVGDALTNWDIAKRGVGDLMQIVALEHVYVFLATTVNIVS